MIDKSFCHQVFLDFKKMLVLNPKFLSASIKSLPLKKFTYHRRNETGVQKFARGQYQCLILISRRKAFFNRKILPDSTYVGLYSNFLIYFSNSLIFRYLYFKTIVSSFFKASRNAILQLSRCQERSSDSICFISSFIYAENNDYTNFLSLRLETEFTAIMQAI